MLTTFALAQNSPKVYWIGNEPSSKVTASEAQALDEFADAIDGITSAEADILYNAAQGTIVASGTITAEQLTSTDDALIKNLLTLGDDVANLTGGIRWIASDNDLGSFDISTSDAMLITGFGGGFDIDGDFTAGTMASDAAVSGTIITASTSFILGDGDYIGVASNETIVFNTVGSIKAEGADFYVGGTAADNVTPSFLIVNDADSDGSATTSESLTIAIVANATPTNSVWRASTTQGAGFDFDMPVTATSFIADAAVSGTVITGTAEALFTNNAAAVTFGAVGTDADVVLAFDAVTAQGSITYMEDEDRFDFDNDVSVGGAITAVSGVDIGTSQAIVGTTAMTIGDGTQTVNINTSDWNIDATGLLSDVVVYSDANGETLNNGTGFASYSAVSAMSRSVFTFTNYSMVITDSEGSGGHGAVKLIDFPEGFIRIDGVIGDMSIESQTGSSDTAPFDMALGTATTNTGLQTLAGTNVDIVAKVDGDLIGGVDTIDLVGSTTQNQDGTSGSTDIWLCVAIEDASMSATGTLVFSGTIVVTWWNLGDY